MPLLVILLGAVVLGALVDAAEPSDEPAGTDGATGRPVLRVVRAATFRRAPRGLREAVALYRRAAASDDEDERRRLAVEAERLLSWDTQ
ncbi:hypothetical protein [Kineosporia sp. A_224]|uniref:hypothetical protein n=1 Tax=Kineosporia sp. A_224 TaxID=1962180 RepID=UPI000B4A8B94|nr:hypothetical protein [Kineosporia sp. A_224]